VRDLEPVSEAVRLTPAKLEIVPFRPEHRAACAAIFAALPEWFGIQEANERYLVELAELPAFVALVDGSVAAFAILRIHFEDSAELEAIAVRPDLHRSGVGGALLAHCEDWLRARGVVVFHVKTLGPSDPDPNYARTRAFYRAQGFRPVFETTAIWGPENPALIQVKLLR
jgi:GNAT superfamily N-acetyltransferase